MIPWTHLAVNLTPGFILIRYFTAQHRLHDCASIVQPRFVLITYLISLFSLNITSTYMTQGFIGPFQLPTGFSIPFTGNPPISRFFPCLPPSNTPNGHYSSSNIFQYQVKNDFRGELLRVPSQFLTPTNKGSDNHI